MLEDSCYAFLSSLASKDPAPGGGSACAFVGCFGIALGSMVGNLTVGKKKYEPVDDDVRRLLLKAENVRIHLARLIEKDAQVFYPLSKAYGLPRDTEQEKADREEILQQALKNAAEVPLEIARYCANAVAVLEEMAEKGTRIALSDVGVGAFFCLAAIKGTKLNIFINTAMLKDKVLKADIEDEIQKIEDEYVPRAQQVYLYVEKAIRGDRQ